MVSGLGLRFYKYGLQNLGLENKTLGLKWWIVILLNMV
jgi:hypothetical protein